MSPSELLIIHSHLDLVQPNLSNQVELKQQWQKKYHDRHAKARSFNVGDAVLVKNLRSGPPWLSGHITPICGPVSYAIKLNDGRVMTKHIDHLCERTITVHEQAVDVFDDYWPASPSMSGGDSSQPSARTASQPLQRSTLEFDTLQEGTLTCIVKSKRGGM